MLFELICDAYFVIKTMPNIKYVFNGTYVVSSTSSVCWRSDAHSTVWRKIGELKTKQSPDSCWQRFVDEYVLAVNVTSTTRHGCTFFIFSKNAKQKRRSFDTNESISKRLMNLANSFSWSFSFWFDLSYLPIYWGTIYFWSSRRQVFSYFIR